MIKRAIIGITIAATFTSKVCAKTELEKFLAEVPSSARLDFLNYQGCYLDIMSSKKRTNSSFQETEFAIAKECKKHITAADNNMKWHGTDATKRAEIIRTFANLALNERQFLFEGKHAPGFELDEWTQKTLQCANDSGQAVRNLDDCYVAKGRELIPYTDEPAETVATAVAGACSATYARVIAQLAKCVGGYPRAENLAGEAAKQFREKVVAAAVLYRAKSRAQQQQAR